jgi:WD40 repeat protein
MFNVNLSSGSFSSKNGPSSDIPLSPEHGGPILCMDNNSDIVVTGSTDHGLRVYNLSNGKQTKQLYTKQYGHTEWVTTVQILPNRKIVSGGMDSNICLWESSGVRCKNLTEHSGSISKIVADKKSGVFLSASYDSSVRIWNQNGSSSLGCLSGVHKGPVTELNWASSLAVTGGRDGLIGIWDLNSEKCISKNKWHLGQISNIIFHSDGKNNLIISTGVSDGIINVVDMRDMKKIFNEPIHKAAINYVGTTKNNLLVTGAADNTVKVFDMQNNFKLIGNMKSADAVFCGDICGNILAAGCGDGNLLCYNLDTMECLWGYGCEKKGGIKVVKFVPEKSKILTAGDSGQGLELCF